MQVCVYVFVSVCVCVCICVCTYAWLTVFFISASNNSILAESKTTDQASYFGMPSGNPTLQFNTSQSVYLLQCAKNKLTSRFTAALTGILNFSPTCVHSYPNYYHKLIKDGVLLKIQPSMRAGQYTVYHYYNRYHDMKVKFTINWLFLL